MERPGWEEELGVRVKTLVHNLVTSGYLAGVSRHTVMGQVVKFLSFL
jgi:hypothetical protein